MSGTGGARSGPVRSGPARSGRPLLLATRSSALARRQAQWVADRLAVPAELVLVSTVGDRLRETPLEALPIRGVFVKEVQQAVLDGRADAAVHSAKDLPARTAAGLAIAAVPVRADPRDVLVGGRLDELLPGATIATGAPRRRAQLAWRRPDLTFTGLRGSIETRLGKIPEGGAVVTALAALERLGLIGVATEVLEPEVLLPQAGQGALAIECREGDDETAALLATIDDASSHAALDAERAVLAELGGGCDAPVGALAVSCEGGLRLEAVVASPEGNRLLRMSTSGGDPEVLGRGLATRMVESGGAYELLRRAYPGLGPTP